MEREDKTKQGKDNAYILPIVQEEEGKGDSMQTRYAAGKGRRRNQTLKNVRWEKADDLYL